MGVPDITIIVRHSKDCDYRDDASYRNCRCRKHLRWFANGKQRQETAGTRSWSQAEAAKHRKIDQLMGKPVGPDPLATKQTVRASVDGFLKAKKVRDITLDAYQRYEIELNRLITFCEGTGVYAIEALTLPVLIAYKATWPDIYPSSTTRSIVQKRLNGFLKFCRDAGYITVLPKLDPVKITEPPTLPLSDEEFNRLLAAVPEEFTVSHRLRDTFAVYYLSKGMPMEEVSKMLGHENIATTQRHYAPWDKSRQDRVNDLAASIWAK